MKRESCRGCGAKDLERFLELGPTPLANSFLKSESEFEGEKSFPLDVYVCRKCFLVQLLDVVAPEILFKEYIYVTGTSETIAAHNEEYAETLMGMAKISEGELVLEVASNDGSLLKCFKKRGARTVGIEPARNIAAMAAAAGIETMNEFFNLKTALRAKDIHGKAKAVIGNNVLAHVDDSVEFLEGCREIVDDCGMVVVEVPYLGDLLDRLEYDTIYHEHLCYFSVNALLNIYERAGLSVLKIDRHSIHGGSLRIYAGLEKVHGGHSKDVLDLAAAERGDGFTTIEKYKEFAGRVQRNRTELLELLREKVAEGKKVAAYGAPAKGNTLLNYCGIGSEILAFTVDKNAMKVGTFTPGMHIPVLPPEALMEQRPDYVLILAWNFADEIMRQQSGYGSSGGKFIIPIPKPMVV